MTHPGGFAGDPAGQQPGGRGMTIAGILVGAVTPLLTMTGIVMGLSIL